MSISFSDLDTQRKQPGRLILLLAGLVMIGPFSIDMYLPAFPAMEQALKVPAIALNQTLSIYLIAYAVMMLWHGTLADAFGRRPLILWSLAVYGVATLGCAIAGNIESLWLFRTLQGLSAGAGLVVGRTVVRDMFHGVQAQKVMTRITQIFSIAPALAPVAGGWLLSLGGWRTVFWGLLVFIICLFWGCRRILPETLPAEARQSLNPSALYRNYRTVIFRREFLLLALTPALNFAGLFIYIAGAPSFLVKLLGVSEQGFLWLFGPMISGILLGATAAGRLAGRISPERIIGLGYVCMGTAGILNIIICLTLPPNVAWNVIPIMLYTIGSSMVAPNAMLFLLALFPMLRGLSSSLQGFLQFSLTALITALLVPLLDVSLISLAFGMIFFTATGAVLWRLYLKTRAPLAPDAF